MQMTARLVPGVTTVTTNARYYALHGFVAEVAKSRELSWDESIDLLRRCEVVVAGATLAHPSDSVTFTAHGSDKVAPAFSTDSIDLQVLSQPGQYAKSKSGFLNVYLGSELEMGILGDNSLSPGERSDATALRRGFDGLFELANQQIVSGGDLQSVPHLSMHHANQSADGRWLASILCASELEAETDTDRARRGTIKIAQRSLALGEFSSLEPAFYQCVAYGSIALTDPVLASIPETTPWRSTLLRRHSINEWRRLWAWLVDQIGQGLGDVDGHTDKQDLAELAIAQCEATTVGEFMLGLPAVVDAAGQPRDAETEVRSEGRSEFEEALAIIALGGLRTGHIEGDALTAFAGRSRSVFDPFWACSKFEQRRPMADFVNDFVFDVLDRSQRIAARRARLQHGVYVVPGRVHEHAGRLWRTSSEGRSAVGLRLRELERNLTAVGVLQRVEDQLQTSAFGEELLNG